MFVAFSEYLNTNQPTFPNLQRQNLFWPSKMHFQIHLKLMHKFQLQKSQQMISIFKQQKNTSLSSPHDSSGKSQTIFGVSHFDPFSIGRLVQSFDRNKSHLSLFSSQNNHKLFIRNVFNLMYFFAISNPADFISVQINTEQSIVSANYLQSKTGKRKVVKSVLHHFIVRHR